MDPILQFLGSRGDPGISVAVLDGPVEFTHPCFANTRFLTIAGSILPRKECPATAHGTHIASVLFADGGSPVAGLVPHCRAISIPIFSSRSTGQLNNCSQLDLARAIILAVEHGADIINVSGGQLSETAEAEPLLNQAIEECRLRNVLIVAAAGNDSCDCIHLPAAHPSVLAVGAMGQDQLPLDSSNWGDSYRGNGILAPGQNILGAEVGGSVVTRSGTSFATPVVTGFVALLLAYQKRLGLPPDPHGVKRIIVETAIDCPGQGERDCRKFLAGTLNVSGAIAAIARQGRQSSINLSTGSAMSEANELTATTSGADEIPATAIDLALKPSRATESIVPSDCGCGGGGHECTCGTKKNPAVASSSARQFVYALGTLGYDFGTEARRDSIQQFMRQGTPTDPAALIRYLDENPEEAERIIWTLNLGTTPIYAIQPVGAFSNEGYAKIIDGFTRQVNGDIPLFAIPGVMAGSVQLLSGLVVPILIPNTRGMTGWSPKAVSEDIEKTLKERKLKKADIDLIVAALPDALRNFLNRVQRQNRNLGIAGADRALNYSATAAFRVLDVLLQTVPRKLELDDILVAKSATCRPGSECFDVDIRFFSPDDVRQPIWVFRFTVDVNDQVPVYVDAISSWTERARD